MEGERPRGGQDAYGDAGGGLSPNAADAGALRWSGQGRHGPDDSKQAHRRQLSFGVGGGEAAARTASLGRAAGMRPFNATIRRMTLLEGANASLA